MKNKLFPTFTHGPSELRYFQPLRSGLPQQVPASVQSRAAPTSCTGALRSSCLARSHRPAASTLSAPSFFYLSAFEGPVALLPAVFRTQVITQAGFFSHLPKGIHGHISGIFSNRLCYRPAYSGQEWARELEDSLEPGRAGKRS